MKRRYIQDRETNELIEISVNAPPQVRATAMLNKPFESFVSPIDKRVINDPSQLREHNRVHGVTNLEDYSPDTRHKNRQARDDRMHGRTKEQKAERIDALKRAFHNDEHRR